ncbi:MAG: fumarylacetoacetate hydrolase family protein [Rickettsiales bacterium]|nr:fumarylacetoacetate hydrolase family protein [Rickettsiales bacterium]
MYLFRFLAGERYKLGVRVGEIALDLEAVSPDVPCDIARILNEWQRFKPIIEAAFDAPDDSARLAFDSIIYGIPIQAPEKIICVGLNYAAHAAESTYQKVPEYPVLFIRFPSTLVPHKGNIIKPSCSDKLDYEGELAVIISQKAYHVQKEEALNYVGGYTIFNDASVRDYQKRTSQWTLGKNFDATGGRWS